MQYLSHSQIDTFQQCNYRWYLTSKCRIPQAPAEALTVGIAFHTALEAASNAKIAHNTLSLERLYEIAEASLRTACDRDTTQFLPDRFSDMHIKLMPMLDAFYVRIFPRLTPIAAEEKFLLHITPEIIFTGRIDTETRQHSIIDFKTSNKPWPTGAEHEKDQATAYLMAKPQAKTVVFVVFPVVNNTCTPQILPTQRTPQQIAAYSARIRSIAHAMRANEFLPQTGPLCAYCGVLGSCDAGQSWLKQHGKAAAVPILEQKEYKK